jgi:hypothetical protein
MDWRKSAFLVSINSRHGAPNVLTTPATSRVLPEARDRGREVREGSSVKREGIDGKERRAGLVEGHEESKEAVSSPETMKPVPRFRTPSETPPHPRSRLAVRTEMFRSGGFSKLSPSQIQNRTQLGSEKKADTVYTSETRHSRLLIRRGSIAPFVRVPDAQTLSLPLPIHFRPSRSTGVR